MLTTQGTEITSAARNFREEYAKIRKATELICEPLQAEDYVVQPVVDVSPPKWHLGHSTWFFETFLLKPCLPGYREFNPDYNFLFNSYYETVGARILRTDRGNLSRPAVEEIFRYRQHVDSAMEKCIPILNEDQLQIFELGLNHEQQHQELLLTDIKYIFGHNPLFPAYSERLDEYANVQREGSWVELPAGIYSIGHTGSSFCFDNEKDRHDVYLQQFKISDSYVTNRDYIEFIEDGGYANFNHWHAEGWDWVNSNAVSAPLYWHLIEGEWFYHTLNGLRKVEPDAALAHISFYEASAYAAWKGFRLPTEFEWEAASNKMHWGERWEWTNSAYLPYPGFKRPEGATGEYNGKFMINQMVLRGASVATPEAHSRPSYRNFFHPHLRWQFTGIRLCS